MRKDDILKLVEVVLVALACPLVIPVLLDDKSED